MKKLERVKTIELIAFCALAALCFILIVFRRDVYYAVSSTPSLHIVVVMLWLTLAAAFFFIFLDLVLYSKHRETLSAIENQVHSDPTSNIANRLSCDEIIESYLDQPLPEDFGCIMVALTNIQDINSKYGHLQGNQTIKRFSTILKLASFDHCFVGRNGGNQFLALFEHGTEESMNEFIERIQKQVAENNSSENAIPIEFCYGTAFHEPEISHADDITSLIALSSKRERAREAEAKKY